MPALVQESPQGSGRTIEGQQSQNVAPVDWLGGGGQPDWSCVSQFEHGGREQGASASGSVDAQASRVERESPVC